MQEEYHLFQGLKRDNHEIRQEPKFLWGAHNIRLTHRDDNTLLSITNEKGTSESLIDFQGNYVGHCVVDNYLIVFTTEAGPDRKEICSYIYRVEYTGEYKKVVLFKGLLNLSTDHPIDTIGIVESELVKKVYWIDGVNQPRVIIISSPEFKFGDNITDSCTDFTYSEDNTHGIYKSSHFNFCRNLKLQETVTVKKEYGSGVFSPGVIQYALTYYNKYGQESNIFYTTPLQYISFIDRAGSPEDRVSNTFIIKVENIDHDFEYIRLYSIHRTSIDSIPDVRQVLDLPISQKDTITFTDSGTTGNTVDPAKLLYIGGRDIVAQSFTSKDRTLFLGNITLNNRDQGVLGILGELNRDNLNINIPVLERHLDYDPGYYYIKDNEDLNQGYNAGFKSNETYRFGIQAQFEDGTWSQPVHICDECACTLYPSYVEDPYNIPSTGATITQYGARVNVPEDIVTSLKSKGVKKLRGCVVFPAAYERDIICQGILNPTVYNGYSRGKNAPFAQASWFFRPSMRHNKNQLKKLLGGNIEYKHNYSLTTLGDDYAREIQSMTPDLGGTIEDLLNPQMYKAWFYVDESIITLNSPDIEFDSSIANLDLIGTKLKILGYVSLKAIYGDISVTTKSPTISSDSAGFDRTVIGYNNTIPVRNKNNGGLVSQYLYNDTGVKIKGSDYVSDDVGRNFMICTWNRDGSLNNDANRPEGKGARSAVLDTKVISNMKFFGSMTQIDRFNEEEKEDTTLSISTPQIFNSNELNVLKLDINYLNNALSAVYQGNVDTLITAGKKYSIPVEGYSLTESTNGKLMYSLEPVRMKYKSAPHLMFSLKTDNNHSQMLLPRHIEVPFNDVSIVYPGWLINNNPVDELDDEDIFENDPTYDKDYGTLSRIGVVLSYRKVEEDESVDSIYDYINGRGLIYGKVEGSDANRVGSVNWVSDSGKYEFVPQEFTGEKIYKIDSSTLLRIGSSITTDTELYDSLGIKYTVYEEGKWLRPITKYYIKINETGNIRIADRPSDMAPSKVPSTGKTVDYIKYTFGTETSTGIAPYLLIADLIREEPVSNKFGGDSEQAKLHNLWVPAGEPISLDIIYTDEDSKQKYCIVPYKYGDTWYSRYDCLKTYPFTKNDTNQVVEIGSFLCETRINLNGRYDRNKGELSNLSSSPTNFNLINEVYSQKDNFFPIVAVDKDTNKVNIFPNQITWTLQKTNAEDIDSWTNITLANTLDLDGLYGEITALQVWNENLMCFQEKALNQINFNSRVQIPTSDGVPIEISNGYKVDGSRSFSNTIGCSNKWSIINTPMGIYFLDSNTDGLYLFNGQLANVSRNNGMDWWVRQNHSNRVWNPYGYASGIINGARAFYDAKYGDVYFTPGPVTGIDQPDALCYSEQLGQFTSLMSYGGTQAMFNFADGFYSLRETDGGLKLYQNNVGNYNDFYGTIKGWDFSFISNDNPTLTKIFDTMELRADHFLGDDLLDTCPVNYMKVDNEYQDSDIVQIDDRNMKKKFRIWRGLFPRHKGTMQRIRNPWAKITLGWSPTLISNKKAVIHDVSVKYTI